MNIIDRVINNPKSTLEGLFTGMLQSAFLSAANAFLATGNTTDWRAYAVAGGVGAATALVGALKKDKQPAPTIAPADSTPTVDPAVAQALNMAMAAMITKQLGGAPLIQPVPAPDQIQPVPDPRSLVPGP